MAKEEGVAIIEAGGDKRVGEDSGGVGVKKGTDLTD